MTGASRLRERGGNYRKGDDFAPYVVVDGTLVTGQNPASSEPAARELIGLLRVALIPPSKDTRLAVAHI